MKSLFPIALFLACIPGLSLGQDLRENAFFKALEGSWKGRGHITTVGQDPQLARNKIQAAFSDDGQMFSIDGGLQVGEDGTQFAAEPLAYRWEFRQSSIEGLYDGRLFVRVGDGDIVDYEVSIDEENLLARLLQISGISGDHRFELVKQIVDKEYVVNITQYNSDGELSATGELKFERTP